MAKDKKNKEVVAKKEANEVVNKEKKHEVEPQRQAKKQEIKETATKKTQATVNEVKKEVKIEKKEEKKHEKHDKKDKKAQGKKEEHKLKEEISEDEDNHEEHDALKDKFDKQLEIVSKKLKLDDNLLNSSIKCLKKLLDKKYEEELNILARKEDEFLFVNFSFGNLPETYSLRPVIIPVPIKKTIKRRVCLIIKDPAQSYIDLNINFNNEEDIEVHVIPYSELKLEYNQYQQKRDLLKLFDVFICDNHLYFSLKKILGKNFYEDKKFPIGITFGKDPEKIKEEVLKASKNFLFYMCNGPNYTVKCGYLVQDTAALINNVKIATLNTLANILKWGVEFEHLKAISLRFTNSIELPLFNQLSEEEIKAGYEVLKEVSKGKVEKSKDESKVNLDKNNNKGNSNNTKVHENVKPAKESKSDLNNKKNKK